MNDKRKTARARALRAARVVSIAAALAVGPTACSASHGRVDASPVADGSVADSGRPDSGRRPRDSGPRDSGPGIPDTGPPDTGLPDTGPPDTGVVADAGTCPEPTFGGDCCEATITEECCDTTFGYWDDLSNCCVVCVEGPMVPPSVPV